MNQTILMGNVCSDPEVRFTSSGKKVTSFRLAVNNYRKGGAQETMWWRISIWGEHQYENMMPYIKKGSALIVTGQMRKPEIYTDREGQPQVSLELNAHHLSFSPFGKGEQQQESGSYHQQSQMAPPSPYGAPQPPPSSSYNSRGMDPSASFSGERQGMGESFQGEEFAEEEIPF